MQETQEMQVGSLGQEDPLEEEEMATHSSILAWKIPETEEPGWPQSMGSQRVGHDWESEQAHVHSLLYLFLFCFFFFCCIACTILVPWPVIEPMPLAQEAWSLNHWTTREVPYISFLLHGNMGTPKTWHRAHSCGLPYPAPPSWRWSQVSLFPVRFAGVKKTSVFLFVLF